MKCGAHLPSGHCIATYGNTLFFAKGPYIPFVGAPWVQILAMCHHRGHHKINKEDYCQFAEQ